MRRKHLVSFTLLAPALCAGTVALGQDPAATRQATAVAELNGIAPQAVADFEAATRAFDAEDYEIAARGFGSVLEAARDFDAALRGRGVALVELGRVDEGLQTLERALELRRSAENLIAVAGTLVWNAPPGSAEHDRESMARARALAEEAAGLDPTDPRGLFVQAEIAMTFSDESTLRIVADRLSRDFPHLMPTHVYAAVSAAGDGRWTRAEREIREAGRLGMPQEQVDAFLATGVGTRANAWRWAQGTGAVTGVWALGLVCLLAAGKVLSGLTLRSIEHDDPNVAVTVAARRLRAIYRRVVTAAGIYWYVSLPFVALLVIALTGSIFYAFLVLGQIPIKLALILAVGALVSLWAIVRSLFVRVADDREPGRAIHEDDAPGLWQMAHDVARDVGTRPVDEIWLTPGTDVAVYERGGVRARMTDTARRALLLGAGVLDGFDQNALRAVLAHEYGHFQHRDTAGGAFALRVRNGMFKFVVALAQAGYATGWNLAFQFVRLYDFVFRRISHGATRLQEVLADRVAIQRYGLDAFREGLSHVIRRSIEFNALATHELAAAAKSGRRVANVYALTAPSTSIHMLEARRAIESAMSAVTTEDDTHPSPNDRFRLGERIHAEPASFPGGEAWELFADPMALKAEMHERIVEQVRQAEALEGP